MGDLGIQLTVGETLAIRRVGGHRLVGDPFYFHDDLTYGKSMTVLGFKKLGKAEFKAMEDSLIAKGLLARAEEPGKCVLTELGDEVYRQVVGHPEKEPWKVEIPHAE